MSANEKHGCHGGDGSTLPTQPAPLLTPELARELARMHQIRPDNSREPLEALAAGRTRCIQPLSEEEQRTAFYEFIDDWMRANKSYPSGIDCWLACANAMRAVKS